MSHPIRFLLLAPIILVSTACDNTPAVEDITITSPEDQHTVLVAGTLDLDLVFDPVGSEATISWEVVSADPVGSVMVDQDGLVHGLKAGSALIRAAVQEKPTIYDEFAVTIVLPTTTGVYEDYYQPISEIPLENLESELHNLLNAGINYVSYGDARYVLEESDLRLGSTTKLYAIYETEADVNAIWDAGATWEREHVWPCAKMRDFEGQASSDYRPNNSTRGRTSDLHNLRAVRPGINGSHSDRSFSQLSRPDSFNPTNDHRGDVARILFYMDTMYDILSLSSNPIGHQQLGYLDELLEWHQLDPVDAFEIRRNEIIFDEQSNRNPFIDHPKLVSLLY